MKMKHNTELENQYMLQLGNVSQNLRIWDETKQTDESEFTSLLTADAGKIGYHTDSGYGADEDCTAAINGNEILAFQEHCGAFYRSGCFACYFCRKSCTLVRKFYVIFREKLRVLERHNRYKNISNLTEESDDVLNADDEWQS